MTSPAPFEATARYWEIGGQVQGVGFRPFVYRLANDLALRGFVRNRSGRVEVVAAGAADRLDQFHRRLISDAPTLAQPYIETCGPCPLPAEAVFSILDSDTGPVDIHVPTDQSCCLDCRRELNDPCNRRYRYPFINCTQCGPRYTLIDALPYDRQRTTMAGFPLCSECQAEYSTPDDRRFHAEPLACPVCGPQLWFASEGVSINNTAEALSAAVEALRAGKIVAVKGVGGYHLMVDANHNAAVQRLRLRKRRPDKPFAVLFADDPQALQRAVTLDDEALAALRAPSRPILLLPRQASATLPDAIAPGLADIGVMLPGNPLQELLIQTFGGPLIATSGNLSGEPIYTDPQDAQRHLTGIADAFLHHNRPIARPADDPVRRPIAGQVRAIRLGRGTAPLEWSLPKALDEPVLAVGGHMKNSIALAWERRLVLSPHIGDLESPRARKIFAQVIEDLQRLYGIRAHRVLCDANPDYASSRWARDSGLPCQMVFHHHAHASALVGEYELDGPWLVFTWDGVGLGVDGTLWGGEALQGAPGHWRRAASMRPFRLPGGEAVARQPWRSAAALHWEAGDAWTAPALVREAWDKGINSPVSSAVGRLFDAAAATLDLCREASYEGQGPMQLEARAAADMPSTPLPLCRDDQDLWRCDWQPLLGLLHNQELSVAERAGAFHASLAEALVQQALRIHWETPVTHVGLTGGVFQNQRLAEQCVKRLAAKGFNAVLPQKLPANDGALAFGQLIENVYQHA